MADTRKYLANASGSPPSQPGATSEGFPQTAVPGEIEATVPGPYWYYQVAEELRNAIIAGGLTPDHALVDQLKTTLEKLFGRTNGGDPNGVLAAKRLYERCWDISKTPNILYVATAADGTVGGTTWTPMREMLGLGVPLRGHIDGLEVSNSATDPDHDVDIAPGVCVMRDGAGNRKVFELGSGLTKQIDAAWSAGTDAGGFPSGLTPAADEWYRLFLLGRDDGVVDAGFDTDASASNLLADASGYSWFRQIRWEPTGGSSNILRTIQLGDRVYLENPTEDVGDTDPGIVAVLAAVTAPPDEIVMLNASLEYNGSTTFDAYMSITSPDIPDKPPTKATSQLLHVNTSSQQGSTAQVQVKTDANSQVRYHLDTSSDANMRLRMAALGWIDSRGRNA